VWTTFEGRLGAVDEHLIADGRLRRLERAESVVLEKRTVVGDDGRGTGRVRRDPEDFVDLLLGPVSGGGSGRGAE
jgi:hypothetical protein